MAGASFHESRSRLDCSDETGQPARALLLRAINRPEQGSRVAGYRIWEMKTRRFGPFVPLRLLYSFNDTTVYLLWLEVHEELE
jgi:hypothetical protein